MYNKFFFGKNFSQIYKKSGFILVITMMLAGQIQLFAADVISTNVASEQQITVTGVVTDESGVTLPGVNVMVRGTTVGQITDGNGRYSINVPGSESILVFSFLGFNTIEIMVGSQTVINIQLQEGSEEIDEIVVVGYGTQRRSDLTGSVSVATADDLLARPQFNAFDGLRGKAAGVNIMSSTGNPLGLDGEAPRITIRGMSSLNTDFTPLFVVDGVQMTDFHTINPNDIERIEVLKDASSTAIYGARGANGVILVTTKRGNVGEGRTVVSYSGYIQMNTMAKKVELLNAAEFVEVQDIAFANIIKTPAGRTTLIDKDLLVVDDNGNILSYTPWVPRRTDPLLFDSNGNPLYDTDWQEEVTRTAISHNHQLSVQHQSQRASSGAFINYADQQGIMLNNYGKRVSVRLTHDAKPKRWLSINTNILVNHRWGNTIDDTGAGARRNIWEMHPILPVKFPDGRWGITNHLTESDYNLEGMSNPVQELTEAVRRRLNTKVFGNVALVFHIAEGLDLRTQLGIDYTQSQNFNYLPTTIHYLSNPNGSSSLSYNRNFYWQEETYLTYSTIINSIHRLNAMVGLSWSETNAFRFNAGNVSGFATDYYSYYNIGSGTTHGAGNSNASRWAFNSYFGRINYTLNDKYLFTGTVRYDGSSRFGENNKWGIFPSAGIGWNISREDFMNQLTWIDNLKLRGSYGQTGNSEIELYRSLALMTASTTLLGGARATTSAMSRMANPDLQWEKTNQLDVGFDLRMFRGRLNMEASFYHKDTKDLLLERPLPYETGFANVFMNMGRVVNSGIDFLVSGTVVDTQDFSWETTFNFNYNDNEVKKLGENDEDILPGNNTIHRIGESVGSFYGLRRLGLWSTSEAAEAARINQAPGESKKSTDREILGNGMAKVSGSLINRFYYKNFDLIVDLQFVTGVQVNETHLGASADRTGVANGLKIILTDSWREDRQNTMVQQIRHSALAGQSSGFDSWWVADGSYIRGNLLQLGYTFDRNFLQSRGLQMVRLNFSVSNAFLIHSKEFRGYDPEGSSVANRRTGQNTIFYQYPRERTFTLGANINF